VRVEDVLIATLIDIYKIFFDSFLGEDMCISFKRKKRLSFKMPFHRFMIKPH